MSSMVEKEARLDSLIDDLHGIHDVQLEGFICLTDVFKLEELLGDIVPYFLDVMLEPWEVMWLRICPLIDKGMASDGRMLVILRRLSIRPDGQFILTSTSMGEAVANIHGEDISNGAVVAAFFAVKVECVVTIAMNAVDFVSRKISLARGFHPMYMDGSCVMQPHGVDDLLTDLVKGLPFEVIIPIMISDHVMDAHLEWNAVFGSLRSGCSFRGCGKL